MRFFPIFMIFFLSTSWFAVLARENTFIPSGGPFFDRIELGFRTIHLPAFTKSVHMSLMHELEQRDYHSFLLLLVVALFILFSSYILIYYVFRDFFGSRAGLLGTTLFHITPSVQKVFWSSATFDFFPKIHLTAIYLFLLSRIFCKNYFCINTKINSKVRTVRAIWVFGLAFSILAIYVRNSSFWVVTTLLILGFVKFKIRIWQLLTGFILVLIFTVWRIDTMGDFTLKSFAATSISISGLGNTSELGNVPLSPIPINDSRLKEFVKLPSYSLTDLVLDKVYFSPPERVLKYQILNWVKNSIFYDFIVVFKPTSNSNTFLYFSFFFYMILFIRFCFLGGFIVRFGISLLLIQTMFGALVTRFSPHQEIMIQIVLCFIFCSILIPKSQLNHHVKSKRNLDSKDIIMEKKGNFVLLFFIFLLICVTATSILEKRMELKPIKQGKILHTKLDQNFIEVYINRNNKNSENYNALEISSKSQLNLPKNSYVHLRNGLLDILVPVGQSQNSSVAVKLERLAESEPGKIRFMNAHLEGIQIEFQLVSISGMPTSMEIRDLEANNLLNSASNISKRITSRLDLSSAYQCPDQIDFLCAVTSVRQLPIKKLKTNLNCINATNGSIIVLSKIQRESVYYSEIITFVSSNNWICNTVDFDLGNADIYLLQNLNDNPISNVSFT